MKHSLICTAIFNDRYMSIYDTQIQLQRATGEYKVMDEFMKQIVMSPCD